jgi:hypothetical protein
MPVRQHAEPGVAIALPRSSFAPVISRSPDPVVCRCNAGSSISWLAGERDWVAHARGCGSHGWLPVLARGGSRSSCEARRPDAAGRPGLPAYFDAQMIVIVVRSTIWRRPRRVLKVSV